MSEKRDHGFAHTLGEAFKRDLGCRYQGPQRDYAEGLNFVLAEAFVRGAPPSEEARDAIANELLRRGWNGNLAGVIAQGLFNAALENDYAPITSRLDAAARQGSVAAQPSLGKLHAEGWANLPQCYTAAAKYFQQAAGT